MAEPLEAWRRASVGELSWVGPQGLEAIPVVPLMLGRSPCVALPYSLLERGASVRGARAAFSVTDTRTGGHSAAVLTGPVEVTEDPAGEVFVEELLDQELVRHPPTRLRADSLLSRRENWWWLPRVLVRLTRIDQAEALPGRDRPTDALAVSSVQGSPAVQVVSAPAWPSEAGAEVEVFGRAGEPLKGRGGPVLVFGHQHSPDVERWESWYRRGRLTGERFVVQESEGEPRERVAPLGLAERYRSHRAVARACRAGLRAAGH